MTTAVTPRGGASSGSDVKAFSDRVTRVYSTNTTRRGGFKIPTLSTNHEAKVFEDDGGRGSAAATPTSVDTGDLDSPSPKATTPSGTSTGGGVKGLRMLRKVLTLDGLRGRKSTKADDSGSSVESVVVSPGTFPAAHSGGDGGTLHRLLEEVRAEKARAVVAKAGNAVNAGRESEQSRAGRSGGAENRNLVGEVAGESLSPVMAMTQDSSEPVMVLDPRTAQVLQANRAARAALGLSREEMVKRTVFELADGLKVTEWARAVGHISTAEDSMAFLRFRLLKSDRPAQLNGQKVVMKLQMSGSGRSSELVGTLGLVLQQSVDGQPEQDGSTSSPHEASAASDHTPNILSLDGRRGGVAMRGELETMEKEMRAGGETGRGGEQAAAGGADHGEGKGMANDVRDMSQVDVGLTEVAQGGGEDEGKPAPQSKGSFSFGASAELPPLVSPDGSGPKPKSKKSSSKQAKDQGDELGRSSASALSRSDSEAVSDAVKMRESGSFRRRRLALVIPGAEAAGEGVEAEGNGAPPVLETQTPGRYLGKGFDGPVFQSSAGVLEAGRAASGDDDEAGGGKRKVKWADVDFILGEKVMLRGKRGEDAEGLTAFSGPTVMPRRDSKKEGGPPGVKSKELSKQASHSRSQPRLVPSASVGAADGSSGKVRKGVPEALDAGDGAPTLVVTRVHTEANEQGKAAKVSPRGVAKPRPLKGADAKSPTGVSDAAQQESVPATGIVRSASLSHSGTKQRGPAADVTVRAEGPGGKGTCGVFVRRVSDQGVRGSSAQTGQDDALAPSPRGGPNEWPVLQPQRSKRHYAGACSNQPGSNKPRTPSGAASAAKRDKGFELPSLKVGKSKSDGSAAGPAPETFAGGAGQHISDKQKQKQALERVMSKLKQEPPASGAPAPSPRLQAGVTPPSFRASAGETVGVQVAGQVMAAVPAPPARSPTSEAPEGSYFPRVNSLKRAQTEGSSRPATAAAGGAASFVDVGGGRGMLVSSASRRQPLSGAGENKPSLPPPGSRALVKSFSSTEYMRRQSQPQPVVLIEPRTAAKPPLSTQHQHTLLIMQQQHQQQQQQLEQHQHLQLQLQKEAAMQQHMAMQQQVAVLQLQQQQQQQQQQQLPQQQQQRAHEEGVRLEVPTLPSTSSLSGAPVGSRTITSGALVSPRVLARTVWADDYPPDPVSHAAAAAAAPSKKKVTKKGRKKAVKGLPSLSPGFLGPGNPAMEDGQVPIAAPIPGPARVPLAVPAQLAARTGGPGAYLARSESSDGDDDDDDDEDEALLAVPFSAPGFVGAQMLSYPQNMHSAQAMVAPATVGEYGKAELPSALVVDCEEGAGGDAWQGSPGTRVAFPRQAQMGSGGVAAAEVNASRAANMNTKDGEWGSNVGPVASWQGPLAVGVSPNKASTSEAGSGASSSSNSNSVSSRPLQQQIAGGEEGAVQAAAAGMGKSPPASHEDSSAGGRNAGLEVDLWYRSMLDSAGVGLLQLGDGGVILQCNRAFATALGHQSATQLVGGSLHSLLSSQSYDFDHVLATARMSGGSLKLPLAFWSDRASQKGAEVKCWMTITASDSSAAGSFSVPEAVGFAIVQFDKV